MTANHAPLNSLTSVLASTRRYPAQALIAPATQAGSAVLLPFAISRTLILVLAFGLQWMLDSGRAIRYGYVSASPLAPLSGTFDCNWYGSVATYGYATSSDISQQLNYHFFPLYPFLMRMLGNVSGLWQIQGGFKLAGVILSHLFFFGALMLLYRLTLAVWKSKDLAIASVWVVCVMPWSFVFSMSYTESIFLFLSLGSILVAYQGRQAPTLLIALQSGLLASLAALTRPQGFVIAVCTVWLLAIVPKRLGLGARAGFALLAGAPPVLATLGFVIYVGIITRSGNLLAISQTTGSWGQGWLADLSRLWQPGSNPMWYVDVLETIGLVVWVILTIWLCMALLRSYLERKRDQPAGKVLSISSHSASGSSFAAWPTEWPAWWAFGLYACAYLIPALLSNPMNGGWGRYWLVVFPCVWLVASQVRGWVHERARLAVTACLAAQMILFAGAVLLQITP